MDTVDINTKEIGDLNTQLADLSTKFEKLSKDYGDLKQENRRLKQVLTQHRAVIDLHTGQITGTQVRSDQGSVAISLKLQNSQCSQISIYARNSNPR